MLVGQAGKVKAVIYADVSVIMARELGLVDQVFCPKS